MEEDEATRMKSPDGTGNSRGGVRSRTTAPAAGVAAVAAAAAAVAASPPSSRRRKPRAPGRPAAVNRRKNRPKPKSPKLNSAGRCSG